jgi:DNA adenine methylase
MTKPAHNAAITSTEPRLRAALKWAGGKYSILPKLLAVFPDAPRFIEPFLGSAVVSLNTNYSSYILSDNNPDLVAFYRHLKKEGHTFIKACESYFSESTNSREAYEKYREQYNRILLHGGSRRDRAMLLLYLSRHGFNGLYRVNSKGLYNVPHGRYSRVKFPREELLNLHRKFQQAELRHGDFEGTMRLAEPGDLVYCDPAYVPLSNTANFSAYTKMGFSLDDHQRLANTARELAELGVNVIISNHDTEVSRELYRDARIEAFTVQRNISRDAQNRGKAPELLAFFGPIAKKKKSRK